MNNFEKIRAIIISLTLFLFPLFFLPITSEFYSTNKLYFLVAAGSSLIIISLFELMITGKFVGGLRLFDIPVLLFVAAISLSVIIQSPNKASAIMTPIIGLLSVVVFAVLYVFLARERQEKHLGNYVTIIEYGVIQVCIVQLAIFTLVFSNISIPDNLKVFTSQTFTTLGTIIDLIAFLGFFFVYMGIRLVASISEKEWRAGEILSFLTIAGALTLSIITYFKIPHTDLPYAPFEYSLKAAGMIFKTPQTMLFGYGIDNFSSLFTQAKDPAYAASDIGSIATYNSSRSLFLQVLSEAGLVGLAGLALIFLRGIYEAVALPRQVRGATAGLFAYLFLAFMIFPASLTLLFLLFVTLGLLQHDIANASPRHSEKPKPRTHKMNVIFSTLIAVPFFAGIAYGIYILTLFYQADLSFRHSIQSINNRNISATYADQFNAVSLNPYNEKYRVGFSQTNIYIANQIALAAKNSNKSLSDSDKSTVTNAIKTAINESLAATILNPQKASNWENRGLVYKSLLGVAGKADTFAIGSYERAIQRDPYNASYINGLGEIYYLTGQYAQSTHQFEAAVKLNSTYTNAFYNLGWSFYKTGDKSHAITAMEQLISLLQDKPGSSEYKKARADLDRFKADL